MLDFRHIVPTLYSIYITCIFICWLAQLLTYTLLSKNYNSVYSELFSFDSNFLRMKNHILIAGHMVYVDSLSRCHQSLWHHVMQFICNKHYSKSKLFLHLHKFNPREKGFFMHWTQKGIVTTSFIFENNLLTRMNWKIH